MNSKTPATAANLSDGPILSGNLKTHFDRLIFRGEFSSLFLKVMAQQLNTDISIFRPDFVVTDGPLGKNAAYARDIAAYVYWSFLQRNGHNPNMRDIGVLFAQPPHAVTFANEAIRTIQARVRKNKLYNNASLAIKLQTVTHAVAHAMLAQQTGLHKSGGLQALVTARPTPTAPNPVTPARAKTEIAHRAAKSIPAQIATEHTGSRFVEYRQSPFQINRINPAHYANAQPACGALKIHRMPGGFDGFVIMGDFCVAIKDNKELLDIVSQLLKSGAENKPTSLAAMLTSVGKADGMFINQAHHIFTLLRKSAYPAFGIEIPDTDMIELGKGLRGAPVWHLAPQPAVPLRKNPAPAAPKAGDDKLAT